jgi:hypothetical protein
MWVLGRLALPGQARSFYPRMQQEGWRGATGADRCSARSQWQGQGRAASRCAQRLFSTQRPPLWAVFYQHRDTRC